MLFKKTTIQPDDLSNFLSKEYATLTASKTTAVEQEQWEAVAEWQRLEVYVHDFLESLRPLQPSLV